jgi:acetylglutamate kinase
MPQTPTPAGQLHPLVLKFGGELLEDPSRLQVVVGAVAAAAAGIPVVVVHGGGKEIDAALRTAGIEKQQVDGLRVTDAATLDVVVAVLAGTINTRLVAALGAAGVAAVGLTGADAQCGLSVAAPPHRAVDGRTVDLGRVGVPSERADTRLISSLLSDGFVPVIACIGVGIDGQLFNVNADTLAGHLAASLAARRLVIAGATAGVLDGSGATLSVLEPQDVGRMIAGGTATAGMIAKLRACEHALSRGAAEVVIADGRDAATLVSAALGAAADRATRIVPAAPVAAEETSGRT